jgi:hypothetical protein
LSFGALGLSFPASPKQGPLSGSGSRNLLGE